MAFLPNPPLTELVYAQDHLQMLFCTSREETEYLWNFGLNFEQIAELARIRFKHNPYVHLKT